MSVSGSEMSASRIGKITRIARIGKVTDLFGGKDVLYA